MAPRITLPPGPDGLSMGRARAARRCPNGPASLRYALTPWGQAGTLRTRRAFTLVEIILAAAIIALLVNVTPEEYGLDREDDDPKPFDLDVSGY